MAGQPRRSVWRHALQSRSDPEREQVRATRPGDLLFPLDAAAELLGLLPAAGESHAADGFGKTGGVFNFLGLDDLPAGKALIRVLRLARPVLRRPPPSVQSLSTELQEGRGGRGVAGQVN